MSLIEREVLDEMVRLLKFRYRKYGNKNGS